jgi:hypothetical protein
MSRLLTALFLILSAVGAAAAEEPSESVTVLVPVVGSVSGANGVRWKTDVDLANDTNRELTVALSLPATSAPMIMLTLPPNSMQRFTDVAAEAFGLETALSPLQVQTMGTHSVRISASVYGVRGTESFRPEPIAIDYGNSYMPLRALHGLSFTDAFRTNVGIVNLSEREVRVTLALQRLEGRNVAVQRMSLPPNSISHLAIQSLFPLITKGDDFTVLVESESRDTYAYASVIDNETNEAHFIQPALAISFQSNAELASSRP